MSNWKVISSKVTAFDPWFKIQQDTVELPDGRQIKDYSMWQERGVAFTVPVTKEGKFILVKQYKHAAGKTVIEFPAGYIDEGEEPLAAAKRELLEETGYTADEFADLGVVTNNPTKVRGKIYVFLVENAHKVKEQQLDEYENIQVIEATVEEIDKMIASHQIWVTGTITAFFLALQKLGQLKSTVSV